jgi:hypothetical protein
MGIIEPLGNDEPALGDCAIGTATASAGLLTNQNRSGVMLGTILIIILILALIGALPTWGHSRNWGYAPSGGLGLIVLIVIILLVLGRI